MADNEPQQQDVASHHNQHATTENHHSRNWSAIWSGVSAIATCAILVTTMVYATLSYYQWRALNEGNRINNTALVEIQRASVLFDKMTVARAEAGFTVLDSSKESVVGPSFGFSPVWFNAGSTATKNLRVFFGEPIESVTPIERPDMRIPQETQWIPGMIGPKGSQNGRMRPIAVGKIEQVKDGKLHIYLWGDAYYNDIFPGTTGHVTKFCQEIGGVNWASQSSGELAVIGIIMIPCMIHNCIDDECKTQP
jgi:hypothetical protein